MDITLVLHHRKRAHRIVSNHPLAVPYELSKLKYKKKKKNPNPPGFAYDTGHIKAGYKGSVSVAEYLRSSSFT